MNDFSKLRLTEHMLKRLAENPSESICAEVNQRLQEQVPGSQLTSFRVTSEPQWLVTGAPPKNNESINSSFARTGVAFEFQFVVREPTGLTYEFQGVFSWVGIHLDDSLNLQRRMWFDLDAKLETHGSDGMLLDRMYFA